MLAKELAKKLIEIKNNVKGIFIVDANSMLNPFNLPHEEQREIAHILLKLDTPIFIFAMDDDYIAFGTQREIEESGGTVFHGEEFNEVSRLLDYDVNQITEYLLRRVNKRQN